MMNTKTNKAVFLDRDGTINREVDNLRDVRQLRLLAGAAGAIRSLNRLGFLVIVISNQPVVARGWLTESQVEAINHALANRLRAKDAALDAIYYCPHHPNANVLKYRKVCRCRKPNTGMIKDAARKFNINLKKSFIVGDHARDIVAGERAGLTTILVETGYGGRDPKYNVDAKPDYVAKNLPAAVSIIKRHAK